MPAARRSHDVVGERIARVPWTASFIRALKSSSVSSVRAAPTIAKFSGSSRRTESA